MANNFQKVANVEEIPVGQSKVFDVAGEMVAVCNVEGKIMAVGDICSHDEGPLGEGELSGTEIECPRHGARFDLETGKALCLPAITPIPVYAVEVRENEVWIGSKN